MKKILSCLIAALAIMMLFTACEEGEDTASLRIVLDRNTARLIAPPDFPLDVKKYRIDGVGPNQEKISITTAKSSATLDGLTIGKWTLTATGLNENGNEIVKGSTTFNLSANNTTCTIVLGELVGKGNLSVAMSWDKERILAPTISVELKRQGEEESRALHAVMNEPAGTAQLTEESLSSGSYILIGKLHSKNVLVSGFVEAVRIVEGMTSQAEIKFSLDMLPSAPGSIQLINEAGLPVYCTITGLEEEVSAGEKRTIKLVPEDGSLKNIKVDWYIDGTYSKSGMEFELTPEPGMHRLDAVAYTDKVGSYGSTGMNFSAIVNTEMGVPGNRFTASAKDGLKLGGNNIVHFLPDGNFLLLSKANSSMQLCSISRSTVNVLQEWTSSDLAFLSSDPVECLSRALDSENITIIVTADNPAKAYHLNYHIPTENITYVEDDRGLPADFAPYNKMTIESYTPGMGFYDEARGTFDFIGRTTGYKDGIYFRMVKGTSPCGDYFPYDYIDFSDIFASSGPHVEFDNLTAFSSLYNGRTFLVGNAVPQILYIRTRPDGRTTAGDSGLKGEKYRNLEEIIATQDDYFIMKGASFLSAFDGITFEETSYLNESGLGDIAYNDGTDMLYGVDRSTGSISIYNFTPQDGKLALKTSVAPAVKNVDAITFSPGGSYLIAYDKDSTEGIDIFRIKTKQ